MAPEKERPRKTCVSISAPFLSSFSIFHHRRVHSSCICYRLDDCMNMSIGQFSIVIGIFPLGLQSQDVQSSHGAVPI
jgi:hypothetical protein